VQVRRLQAPALCRAIAAALQMWEEDPEHFAHAMGTDDPFRSKAETLLLTLLEVGCHIGCLVHTTWHCCQLYGIMSTMGLARRWLARRRAHCE